MKHLYRDMRSERATRNKLLMTKSPTAYVHEVLSQHLAMRLIQGDMGLDEAGAIEIMKTSTPIGELLNHEE